MTNDDKAKKSALKKEYKANQKREFLENLPIPISKFKDMFDFIDVELQESGCDNTMKITAEYLNNNNIPERDVINWLNENGAFCDCEVIYNAEELFDSV